MDAIKVKKLNFSYNNKIPILRNLNFSIPKNKYTVIVGHNGSGKSTLSKILVGILVPDTGDVKILGKSLINEQEYEKKNLGVVFQNPDNQFIGTTVKDDIAFGLENLMIEPSKMMNIINTNLDKVSMREFADHEPHRLSGGQKQKVAIASVLSMSPEIIIFDESTSMLDPKSKKEINNIMRDLVVNDKKTIISITHDMNEAQSADNIIVLYKGKLVQQGPPSQIFKNLSNLKKWSLDFPNNVKASYMLKNHFNKFPITTESNSLVKEIWKLISTK